MSEEYKSALSGGLSLKGGLFKKKKKKRKLEEAEKPHDESTSSGNDGRGTNSTDAAGGDDNGGEAETSKEADSRLTPSQRKFKERQEQREVKRIRNMVSKTHRERVEDFNALLASMTEHNDIPRCSAAGNG